MTFGTWFEQKRKAADLTQKQISDKLNYSSPQFVSNWSRGLSIPPKSTIPKLAKIIGVEEKLVREIILEDKIDQLVKEWMG